MDRRTSLKTLLAMSASVLVLPSCLGPDKKVSVTLKNLKIEAHDEETVSRLANALIPPGNKPGAVAVGAPAFLWTMLDDCYSTADQQKFLAGLKEFDSYTTAQTGDKFKDALPAAQNKILKQVEIGKQLTDNAKYFFEQAKWLIIRGYTQSEYYLTNIQKYVLVPGKFYGCVPVKKSNS